MDSSNTQYQLAQSLLQDFLNRSGITSDKGNTRRRYLWTDALALRALLMVDDVENDGYSSAVRDIIHQVHHVLGRFRNDDHRKGWISGLPEEEGSEHPTRRGLRIGKNMPERKPDEPFDRQLEWERDGQYFHYNSQWVYSLVETYEKHQNHQYLQWAADMINACKKFIYCNAEPAGMFWKMSTDLTLPLVRSMGAHDPLDGLICCESILANNKAYESVIGDVRNDFEYLCQGKNWSTTDPLGLGVLLLNLHQATKIVEKGKEVPRGMHPAKLLEDTIQGLKVFSNNFDFNGAANQRLAFRECGLSLGLRIINQHQNYIFKYAPDVNLIHNYYNIADQIDDFWSHSENRKDNTWTDHLDINAVMLASSLFAKEENHLQLSK